MALGLKIFHTPKPRGFNHVNIYYDPEKEEREERENRVNKELGIKQEEFKTSIKRGSFRRLHKIEGGGSGSDVRSAARAANIRFAIIAAVLILVFWLLLM
ncbi:MAG: hypothetical protein MJ001_06155 [Paludibacteraceae bacterium]|nr:hypothetical protein [Candidatus Colousia faecequi]MCQ2338487.1 hypothetical protein [Paludibacteraceae bacterium]